MTDPATVLSRRTIVLVVDDEKVIASTLAVILTHAGFEAHAVFSGAQAIEALDTLRPDLLLTDVDMPGMTGIEAAIITRIKLPTCKILLFSGQAATVDLLKTARAQGHEFEILSKPLHPTDLLETLRVNSPESVYGCHFSEQIHSDSIPVSEIV
jgi:CheY-like chemotaxis protein